MKTQVRRVMPTTNSCIVGQFRDADLLDCYAIDLLSGTPSDMRVPATTSYINQSPSRSDDWGGIFVLR
jgi:hypothetical protein